MDIIDMNALVGISARPGGGLVGIHQTAHPVPDIQDLVKDCKISIFFDILVHFCGIYLQIDILMLIHNIMETLIIQFSFLMWDYLCLFLC